MPLHGLRDRARELARIDHDHAIRTRISAFGKSLERRASGHRERLPHEPDVFPEQRSVPGCPRDEQDHPIHSAIPLFRVHRTSDELEVVRPCLGLNADSDDSSQQLVPGSQIARLRHRRIGDTLPGRRQACIESLEKLRLPCVAQRLARRIGGDDELVAQVRHDHGRPSQVSRSEPTVLFLCWHGRRMRRCPYRPLIAGRESRVASAAPNRSPTRCMRVGAAPQVTLPMLPDGCRSAWSTQLPHESGCGPLP